MQESVSRSMSRTPDGISDQFGAQSRPARTPDRDSRGPRTEDEREGGFYRLTPRSVPKILIFALLGRALVSLSKIWME